MNAFFEDIKRQFDVKMNHKKLGASYDEHGKPTEPHDDSLTMYETEADLRKDPPATATTIAAAAAGGKAPEKPKDAMLD